MRGMSAVAKTAESDPIVFQVTEDVGFGQAEPGWYSYDPETGENKGPYPTRDEAETAH